MAEIRVVYSKERETWNLFVGAEWYAEDADYEVIDNMARNMSVSENESEEENYE